MGARTEEETAEGDSRRTTQAVLLNPREGTSALVPPLLCPSPERCPKEKARDDGTDPKRRRHEVAINPQRRRGNRPASKKMTGRESLIV
mmetsp:Transcript_45821/g.90252  ORF Transcript_45821/g.90252 Transcript_45821/m.90252 type:complete len:89 (-) Transcript_45821:402-668(-)